MPHQGSVKRKMTVPRQGPSPPGPLSARGGQVPEGEGGRRRGPGFPGRCPGLSYFAPMGLSGSAFCIARTYSRAMPH